MRSAQCTRSAAAAPPLPLHVPFAQLLRSSQEMGRTSPLCQCCEKTTGRLRPPRANRQTDRQTHTHTHSRTHARTHSLTHARTHARTHAHTHTYTLPDLSCAVVSNISMVCYSRSVYAFACLDCQGFCLRFTAKHACILRMWLCMK